MDIVLNKSGKLEHRVCMLKLMDVKSTVYYLVNVAVSCLPKPPLHPVVRTPLMFFGEISQVEAPFL